MEYSTFDGLKILGDEKAKSYKLKVGPGETKCVIMEASFGGFGTSGSYGTSIS